MKTKLIALMGGVTSLLALAALLLAMFLVERMNTLATRWTVHRASSVAAVLAEAVAPGLDFGDAASIGDALQGLAAVEGAIYGAVRDGHGQVVARWGDHEMPTWVGEDWPDPGAFASGDDELQFVTPIHARGGAEGLLLLGLSLHDLSLDQQQSRRAAGMAALGLFLLGLGVSFVVGWTLFRPIASLARATRAIVETRDLTRTFETLGQDELGFLARSVGAMVQQQRDILGRIGSLIEGVTMMVQRVTAAGAGVRTGSGRIQRHVEETSRAANDMHTMLRALARDVEGLEHNAADSSSSLIEVASSNREVANNVQIMADSSRSTIASMERMARCITEIANNIDQLNDAVNDTTVSQLRMDRAIGDVHASSSETARLSEQVLSHAEVGVEALRKTLHGIENIKASAGAAAAVLAGLSGRISEIGAILRVIDEVAAQTKLLSLNAAIIAAQSGEHGRGFGVVADQIKALAHRTGTSTREINTLIAGIQTESRNATAAMGVGISHVEVGVELGAEAALALAQIQSSATASATMIHQIASATVEHSRGSKQITTAIERLAHTVGQISNYSQEQARDAEQVLASSKNVTLLTEQVRRSSEEQAASSHKVIAALEGINTMVARLTRSQKEQTASAEVVQKSIEAIRRVATEQADVQQELDSAIETLSMEATGLQREMAQYKH